MFTANVRVVISAVIISVVTSQCSEVYMTRTTTMFIDGKYAKLDRREWCGRENVYKNTETVIYMYNDNGFWYVGNNFCPHSLGHRDFARAKSHETHPENIQGPWEEMATRNGTWLTTEGVSVDCNGECRDVYVANTVNEHISGKYTLVRLFGGFCGYFRTYKHTGTGHYYYLVHTDKYWYIINNSCLMSFTNVRYARVPTNGKLYPQDIIDSQIWQEKMTPRGAWVTNSYITVNCFNQMDVDHVPVPLKQDTTRPRYIKVTPALPPRERKTTPSLRYTRLKRVSVELRQISQQLSDLLTQQTKSEGNRVAGRTDLCLQGISIFPLRGVDNLKAFDLFLKDEHIRELVTEHLTGFWRRSLEKSIRRMMGHVISRRLYQEYGWENFKHLTLYSVIADSLLANKKIQATRTDIEKELAAWIPEQSVHNLRNKKTTKQTRN